VKEHGHHWDSQQNLNQSKSLLFLTKHILNASVLTHTRQHMHLTYAKHFLRNVGRLSITAIIIDRKKCKGSISLLKETLLHLLEFNPNFTSTHKLSPSLHTKGFTITIFFFTFLRKTLLAITQDMCILQKLWSFCLNICGSVIEVNEKNVPCHLSTVLWTSSNFSEVDILRYHINTVRWRFP
jgi:hypothetical protein